MATKTQPLSYDLYFAAPADRVWNALTDAALTEQYFYGCRIEGRLEKGGPLSYAAGGMKMIDGEVLDVERGKRLVAKQRSLWDDKVARDPASTVSWEIAAMGPQASRLTLVHDGFDGESETYRQSAQGWPVILSSMKTLVETGKPLALPAQG